jgi:hypothetical protein
MERLTHAAAQRAFVLATLLAIAGTVSMATANRGSKAKMTEEQMEQKAPISVPGYQLIPGPEGMAYSYRMPASTYETLKPFGIVARNYTDGAKTFDVVLITSDSHESFHDPTICFSGQGWTFNDKREEVLDLPDGRRIPMTVVDMQGPTGRSMACYFYRGPSGYVARPQKLQLDMFREVLFGRKPADSTFYRFMPAAGDVTLEQLKAFIKTYMVSAARESGGFF